MNTLKIKQIDISPQFISDYVTLSAANTYTEKQINLPINPGATVSGGHVRVMEFLKVFADFATDTIAEDAYVAFQLTYKTQADLLSGPDVSKWIYKMQRRQQVAGAAGAFISESPFVADLTDGNGNGILIGQQAIFLGAKSAGQTAALTASFKILYRFKDVPIEEYIGMVSGN